jgi:glycosyltransferase involved in cell wall biosynthesis
MSIKENLNFKTGIVVFNNGAFGGAAKRVANLFLHLNRLYGDNFYFFVNKHLYNQIKNVYGSLPDEYIRIIDIKDPVDNLSGSSLTNEPQYFKDVIESPVDVDKRTGYFRKVYRFFKNKHRQREIFKQIENYRAEFDIKVLNGWSAGVLPLAFYFKDSIRRASVVFSDTDSWFTDVDEDTDKLWYRKYYSYNHVLENSDLLDFLSPYILKGVKLKGVVLDEEKIMVSPCSFVDYSKCKIGDKKNIEIAFCARLEPDKNPLLYLEAAKELLKKHPEVKFHLLGEGTLVYEIKNFIQSNELGNSVNFSFLKQPSEIFTNTSVFVSLQTGTNYPSQSVLEAMACGNAIVASNRGDTELLINNKNGVLINLDVKSLIVTLDNLIKNPEETFRLGFEGSVYVRKEHTIEKYAEYFLNILNLAYNKHFG